MYDLPVGARAGDQRLRRRSPIALPETLPLRCGLGLLSYGLLLVAGGGCSGGSEGTACRRAEDCQPGQTCVLGQCRSELGSDGGVDAMYADGGADAEALPDVAVAADGGAGDAGGCVAVDDGVVTRSELIFQVGMGATYRVNADAPVAVDVVGVGSGGEPLWDFTAPTPSDRPVVDELLPLTGAWYAGDFPEASYVAWLDDAEGTLGVFRVTDSALQLLGIVSETENETRLTYDPPVDLLRFPLQEGTSWVVNTTSSGWYRYTMTTLEETYQVSVDARGRVVVPAGSFHALRVRTDFEQHVPLTMIYTRRILYLWVTECFGIVAKIVSVDNETNPSFTEAAEYRRMSL